MKAFLISLVVVALCLLTVHSLKCYTCKGETSNSKCQTATAECVGADDVCQTKLTYSEAGLTGVEKTCGACAAPDKDIFISCCKTDLCNKNGATSVKISYLALVVSVGFIGTMLRAV
uniref:Lymphocyte antigen 6E-like n=1 Tax=Geotrypetes seraphini TaxID=260995 RepID=A0A6P8QQP9_GEOSA|nr:lymphocyte antigen 6E-like [Geotrypetes seraphini]